MSTLDLDNPPPYSPGDWIGKGKTFSYAELPSSVVNMYKHAIKLPTHLCIKLILPATTPISDFMNVALPPQDQDLIHKKAEEWFSSEPPTSAKPHPFLGILPRISKMPRTGKA